ncbi:hypothetical protein GCM10007304_30320 [Rhodococcoides trifolii]|uniref:Helix-turn-helix domain-containing protein n=1 Tax=Rhodococcoides trifolii TaxID=908250 RepID=A0A917FYH2_9NOCA|nr:hypothetical protein GCM10007304_30320 [Rhodococcus trifolii]
MVNQNVNGAYRTRSYTAITLLASKYEHNGNGFIFVGKDLSALTGTSLPTAYKRLGELERWGLVTRTLVTNGSAKNSYYVYTLTVDTVAIRAVAHV